VFTRIETWREIMGHILKFTPLPLLAALFVACSGAPEPEPAPPLEGDGDQALTVADDGDVADKGRRSGGPDGRHRRRRGRGHGHHPPPPPPSGQACEVAGQSFPDGAGVPSGDSCNSCGCNDGDVICTLALCEPVFCAEFLEVADGVCSRFPLDPCKFQDPDCGEGGGGGASCEAAGQTFEDGSAVPSGDSCNTCGCTDGSITCTEIACEPQVCALFVEESDGVCSRFPLDPCKSQDPDCLEPVPTDPGAP
jgi:hypothetical protein